MRASPRISVAVPVYNEETVVPELIRRVLSVLDDMPGGAHELLLVDDGSSDSTPELLQQAVAADPRVTVVSLSRNFGHQAALGAAMDHVAGEVAVVMDGDLQDRPELIPQFVDEYRGGADVVYAQRVKRKEGPLLRFGYRAFYWLMSRLSDVRLPEGAGDFGLMSRRVVDVIRNTPERHRYWRGLRGWAGFRQVGIAVERDARHSGRSKYSLRKLVKLALDGIFSFSIAPLRAASLVGAATVAASLGYSVYAVVAKLAFDQSPRGFTALIVAITFLSGVQLLFLGVVGEYVGRIFEQVKGRPIYVVDRFTRQSCNPNMPSNTEICTSDIGGGGLENDSCSPHSVDTLPATVAESSTSVAATVCSSLDLLDMVVSRE